MNRFWTRVTVVQDDDQYLIALDETLVKTSNNVVLKLPDAALADAVAAEWAQVTAQFSADDLKLTQLAAAARELTLPSRSELERRLLAFGLNDLLCYRSDAPAGLVARESEIWQPWLDWTGRELGIHLESSVGLTPITQTGACREAFAGLLGAMSEYELAALAIIVPPLGSLVLGLAVRAGALRADAACEAASLGELWQEEKWGVDAQAAARRQAIHHEVAAAARFLALCRA